MKNIKLLLGLLSVVIIMASCATMQEAATDDDLNNSRTQQIGNRLYLQDPFYGSVVLERDPYTGRYYDVTFGSRFGTGFYGGYPYGGGLYRGNNRANLGRGVVIQQQQGPSREQIRQNREEARKTILGK